MAFAKAPRRCRYRRGFWPSRIAFGTVAARKGFSLHRRADERHGVLRGGADHRCRCLAERADRRYHLRQRRDHRAHLLALHPIGASMRPWFGGIPERGLVYLTLYLLVEPPWLLGTRYYNNGGRDPAFVLGSCVVCWLSWVIPTVPGYWLGASIGDPQRFGIDLIMPAFFVVMLLRCGKDRAARGLDRRQRCCGRDVRNCSAASGTCWGCARRQRRGRVRR